MQYPWFRWLGSGTSQSCLLHFIVRPFTSKFRLAGVQVPLKSWEVVSMQAAVPPKSSAYVVPSGTTTASGFEHRPEQGEPL